MRERLPFDIYAYIYSIHLPHNIVILRGYNLIVIP